MTTELQEMMDSEAAWEKQARQYCDNADYYRNLVVEIGELFGIEAKTADDGSVMQDVLCAKVPELVHKLKVKCDEMKRLLSVLDKDKVRFLQEGPYYAFYPPAKFIDEVREAIK